MVQSDQGRYREVENLHSRLQGLLDGGSRGDCGGRDILESRASRTHLAQPWPGSGQLGDRECRSETMHRRGFTWAKG